MFRYAALILVVLMIASLHYAKTDSVQPVRSSVISPDHIDICNNESPSVATVLEQLSSGNYDITSKARHVLLNIAYRSADCRQAVIRALIAAMDEPELDFERQPLKYNLWREGSELLGELKAIEALDLLISHLDLTNGFHSSSMVFQPAILGVRQMGVAAIPKLAVALRQSSKPRIRLAAVYCLTDIGGTAALVVLKEARDSETNSCVSNFIKVSLNTFTYKSKSGVSFDTQAPRADTEARQNWMAAFQCVD
jgi:hypothetical protein